MWPIGSPNYPVRRGCYQALGHPPCVVLLIIRSHPVGPCQFNPAVPCPCELDEVHEIRVRNAVIGLHISQMIDTKIDIEIAQAVEQTACHVSRRIELYMPTGIAR